MPIVRKPIHIFEPTSLQCGQAVIAMISGTDINTVTKLCATERETDFKTMKRVLTELGIVLATERKQVEKSGDLPRVALLSLETPKCWHWSLYFEGIFYDPEYGVLKDFPPSDRKYFWELKNG